MSEPKKQKIVTNRQFSETKGFMDACSKVGIEPTQRQASKFRMGKGIAYKEGK
jgi:hypothetical protein